MLRAAINGQVWLSRRFEGFLPLRYRVDGNTDFLRNFVPKYLSPGSVIYDVGSGKQPYLSVDRKESLRAVVVGLDISAEELARAPEGAYDRTICKDVTQYRGDGDADVVICQSLLEHVDGVAAAFRAVATALHPGGTALLFVPCRNALFARLNLLLPESLKMRLLFTLFPSAAHAQGFPAYYDRCTPGDFRNMAREVGLEVVETRCYYRSGYFDWFFPLMLFWRLWMAVCILIVGREQAAETFSMALRKPAPPT